MIIITMRIKQERPDDFDHLTVPVGATRWVAQEAAELFNIYFDLLSLKDTTGVIHIKTMDSSR